VADEPDMSAPVTRGEMNRSLEIWAGAIIDKLTTTLTTTFTTRLDNLAVEMRELVKTSETKILKDVKAMLDPFQGTPQRLEYLERQDLPKRVDALDEAQLPDRVRDLEARILGPKP